MSDLQVRGYTITSTIAYLQDKLPAAEMQSLLENLSPQTKGVLQDIKPIGWYPVATIAELNWTIVSSLGKNDEARSRDALINCGRYMAREATNTFLKLLMRMLTPGIFAKKLPDFWSRDCTGGRLSAEVSDLKIACRIFETPGFDHVGAVAAGWVGFALEAMGKSIRTTTVTDWSLEKPNVDGAGFQFVWSA